MTRTVDGEDLSRLRLGWPQQSVLASVSDAVLDDWLHAGRVRRFRAKQQLIDEGQLSCSVFLLLSGCVKVITQPEDNSEALLAVRVGGDLVGELAALDGQPRWQQSVRTVMNR